MTQDTQNKRKHELETLIPDSGSDKLWHMDDKLQTLKAVQTAHTFRNDDVVDRCDR